MKTKKVFFIFGGVIVAMLVYVFGAMYLMSKDQGGSGSNASTESGGTQTGGTAANNASPGNSGSSGQTQATGSTNTQSANPTGTVVQNTFNQSEVAPQTVNAPTNALNQQSAGSEGTSETTGQTSRTSQTTTQSNSNPNIQPPPTGLPAMQ